MNDRYHSAQRLAATFARAGRRSFFLVAVCGGLAGCAHKRTPVVLPQVSLVPIQLEEPPDPDPPMMIEAPVADATPPPVLVPPPPKPVRRRRTPPPAPAPVTPPVQVAAAEPAAAAIGALSTGGETTPQSRQVAKDLIDSIEKRLAALPNKVASQEKDLVRQVRSFVKQAQQALDSGDAEGANNLATKAKLLMDDVEKK